MPCKHFSRKRRVGDQYSRVSRAPGGGSMRHPATGHLLYHANDLGHATTFTRPQI